MQRSLLNLWFFFLVIGKIQALKGLWKPNNYVDNYKTMKMILDSCYENDNVANPTLILGDFREFIDKSSVIWLNREYHFDPEEDHLLDRTGYRASKMILIQNSPRQLRYDLEVLSRMRWWNHTALFFIIEKNDNTCGNAVAMLRVSWILNIPNAIYICTRWGHTELVTSNQIANYAPSPWNMVEGSEHFNLFYQIFDPEISCENLHYDKTRVIHGHDIKIGVQRGNLLPSREYYLEDLASNLGFVPTLRLLQCVVESLNATGKIEMIEDDEAQYELLFKSAVDMTADTSVDDSMGSCCSIIYPEWFEMVAVIKLGPEISTLTKIRRLWSVPVLIAAAVAIGILFIVLTVLNHDVSLAILDLTRFLVYTSILINNRSHAFRIFFASMLILIIISNGVFQESIAAFLTKRERESPVATIDELIELKYKIYSPRGQSGMNEYISSNYDIEETTYEQCIELVLNSSRHACLIDKQDYEEYHNLQPLDYVRVSTMPRNSFFLSRPQYPLRDRIQMTIMKIFESGIMKMWKNQMTHWRKIVRQTIEAEWSSSQYKPVKLYKLTFAFQLLALGLTISTIVFFLELLVAKYG